MLCTRSLSKYSPAVNPSSPPHRTLSMTTEPENDPTEEASDEPTASGFITAMVHDCDSPNPDTILGEGLLRKISLIGAPAHEMEDGEEMCATVQARFFGLDTDMILLVDMTAVTAHNLGIDLIERAREALGE